MMPIWIFPTGHVWHNGEISLRPYHHDLDDFDFTRALLDGRLTEKQERVWRLLRLRMPSLAIAEAIQDCRISAQQAVHIYTLMALPELTDKLGAKYREPVYRLTCRYTEADTARILGKDRSSIKQMVNRIIAKLDKCGDEYRKNTNTVVRSVILTVPR